MTEGFGHRRFLAPRHDASHAIRVPRVRILPSASFRSHLTMGTLAVRLGVPVIKASKGLAPSSHFPVGFRLPVDSARQGAARPAWRTSSSPGDCSPEALTRTGLGGFHHPALPLMWLMAMRPRFARESEARAEDIVPTTQRTSARGPLPFEFLVT